MSEEEFFAGITGHNSDLRLAVEALRSTGHGFCLVGGLAVNHYAAEPMVTLDADFAVVADAGVADALRARGFVVEVVPPSINARLPGSRLRLQVTVNSRYAGFPARAVPGRLFGVDVPVAALADLVQGKLWAFQDTTRRPSKRKKDGMDLLRLCENCPEAVDCVPSGLIEEVDDLRPKT
jgi:hypothetical protein